MPLVPAGPSPFVDPPKEHSPHDVEPSERNPYNDLDYSPFIVTDNPSAKSGDEPSMGGLPGMLLRAMMQQGQVQPGVDSASITSGAPEYNSDGYGSPQGGLLGRLLALQDERARNAVDAYGSHDPDGSRMARTYATAPQEFPTTPQKPVRILSTAGPLSSPSDSGNTEAFQR